jgi:hypothetical protein
MATLIVESKAAAFLKWFVVGVCIGSLCAAMSSCAGAGHALQAAGEHGTQLGLATAGGATVVLFTPPGLLACAAAGLVGGLVYLISTPAAKVAVSAATTPWGLLILVALGVLAVRAWRHYPQMFAHFWMLAKVAAKGLLGGTPPK